MEIESAADVVRMTRGGLVAAGFARRERDGIVWFEGGASDASPIVLVHGVNDQAGTWCAIAPLLARAHRVILPDLPGHGESAPAEGPLPLPLLSASLETAIGDRTDIILVGNSLGGWLAMLYALEHPERVRHLVLESSGGLALPFASPVIAHDRDEALLILRAVHGPAYVAPEWVIEALLARAIDSPMLRITDAEPYFVGARLGDLRTPTTIVWGADDGVLPLSYAEALQKGIPASKLHVLEGAAHIPHLQQPERYLACLTSIS